MKKKEIEKMLRSDLKAHEPDVWDKIAAAAPRPELVLAADAGEATIVSPRRRTRAAAAVLCLIAFAAAVLMMIFLPRACQAGFNIKYSATGYVLLDINPSVQLKLDERGRVTKAVPLNEDARVMLTGRLDGLAGMTDAEASKAILGYAAEVGYVSVDKRTNAVLVSAALGDKKSEQQLEKKLQTELTKAFKDNGVYGVVITDVRGGDVAAQAEALGVTESKYRLVLEARSMGVVITDAEVPAISVAEIYERIEERADALEELVSPELEDEYEELTERAEDSLETLTERVEEILELLEDKTEDLGDAYEELLGRMEDTLDLIEDSAGIGLEGVFDSLYDQLAGLHSGDPELDGLLDAARAQIEAAVADYDAIAKKIEAEREKLLKKQEKLIEANRGKNDSHAKDKDFDKDYEKWLKKQQKLYETDWDRLKAEWEAELDD